MDALGFHVCWPTSLPRVCITRVVRCPPGLPSPWEGGGPGTAPWPQQQALLGHRSPWKASQPLRTPHLPTVAPGDLALRGARAPGPAPPPGAAGRRGQAKEDALGMASVPRLCPRRRSCMPGGPVGPGLSLTGTCASDRRKGGWVLWESTCRVLLLRQESRAPLRAGSRLHPGLWLQLASTLSLPALPVCHTRGSFIGRGSSPPQIYFQHPDDRFRAAWAVLHSLLISAWTGCPALASASGVQAWGVRLGTRLSARGQVGVLPLGVIPAEKCWCFLEADCQL